MRNNLFWLAPIRRPCPAAGSIAATGVILWSIQLTNFVVLLRMQIGVESRHAHSAGHQLLALLIRCSGHIR